VESHVVEWKESWRDEYLQWICGFANAQGGRLEIGRNDKGELIGIIDIKRLLEELPNKIRTTMGIVADVNLCSEDGREYIAIDVIAHPNAISYRGYFMGGEYHAVYIDARVYNIAQRYQKKTIYKWRTGRYQ
jgi:ATP-dependent DNA helicase RecG